MSVLFEAKQISVSFGGIRAVDSVSFEVEQGEIFSIIGPNGAGKTTIFNLISRIYNTTEGELIFDGSDIAHIPPYKIAGLGIARTFQNIELFANATLLQNLLIGRHCHSTVGYLSQMAFLPSTRRAEILHRQEVEEVIAFLDLQRYRDTLIANLPYGVRKVVELGRALCTKPKLLLLDEPSSGLNVEETEGMGFWIEDIKKDLGITVIMVEHDMALVSQVSDRVMALNYGKVIAMGSTYDVQNHPEVVRAYIGGDTENGRMTEPLLHVDAIETFYGPIQAIRGVSLQVEPHQIVTVLGANGAGKTTVLRTVSGILDPEAGKVVFEGRDIAHMAPDQVMRMGICHVPEGREVFPFLTVRENLMMGSYTRRDTDGIAKDLALCFGYFPRLQERQHQRAGLLSGGEQQMLAISRALMGKPKLLLLDEPSLGLSPLLVQQIFEIIRRINREQGVAILLVEQNAHMALKTADYGYVLEVGRIVAADHCATLLGRDDIKEFYLGQKEAGVRGQRRWRKRRLWD